MIHDKNFVETLKNDFSSVIDRLMQFFEVDELQKVAHIIGMNSPQFYARKKSESIPYKEIINSLQDTNANLEWIFYGIGEKTITAKLNLSKEYNSIQVKFYPDISASAGMGCLNGDFCEYELISIDKSLVPNVMSKNIEAIRINGDSMSPTIHDRDVIFVDKSQRNPINGKIFVIKFSDETFAKRIFKSPKGYIIKSDNPQYPQYEVQADDFEILGQIIYNMEYMG